MPKRKDAQPEQRTITLLDITWSRLETLANDDMRTIENYLDWLICEAHAKHYEEVAIEFYRREAREKAAQVYKDPTEKNTAE